MISYFSGIAGVSFAYQFLSVQTIHYAPAYGLVNFWGDFAGMVGTLMGLDAIKVLSAIRIIPVAVKKRSFFTIQEHFNG
jgi:hypothetical protein